jgi:hypothetical protein
MRSLIPGSLAAVLLAFLAVVPSRADIIITPGNNPQPGEENVLLTSGETGHVIHGTTQSTGQTVFFTSSQLTGLPQPLMLTVPTSGTPRIEGGAGNSPLTQLGFSVTNDFTDAIFDVVTTGAGRIDFTVSEVSGPGLFESFSLLAGNNFFTIVAINGETLTAVDLSSPIVGIQDVEAIRVSGAVGDTPSGVPDTGSTIAMLLGATGMLVAFRSKRRDELVSSHQPFPLEVRRDPGSRILES